MNTFEKLYANMPLCIQNFMISCKGWQNSFKRFGNVYRLHRQFLLEFDNWPLERKLEFQRTQLIQFIRFAYDNSPFYQNLYCGIDIDSIQSVADLEKLPIIDKEIIRQNIKEICTVTPESGGLEMHTGGTTGKSLVVMGTKDDLMKRMAMLDHFKSRVGFEHRKMKRLTFNGKHIIPPGQKKKVFWRYNAACRQLIFSSFHLTEENMSYYVKKLNQFQPDSIDGFFTCMIDLANYIERQKISLTFQPIAIFPTSETLTKEGRELLERVFKTKVYDQYASSEGAPFITECKDQIKHIELSSGVFEHMNDSNDEILITSFLTHGTPLIRYRIGDRMKFAPSDATCSCGNNSPIIESIEGRKLEFLYNAEGAKINAGNISNLFKNIPNSVIRAQLIQDRMDEITILLEVDSSLYQDCFDELLSNEFRYKFGETTRVIIKHVDSIPREKSGKFQMIKNNISEK